MLVTESLNANLLGVYVGVHNDGEKAEEIMNVVPEKISAITLEELKNSFSQMRMVEKLLNLVELYLKIQ